MTDDKQARTWETECAAIIRGTPEDAAVILVDRLAMRGAAILRAAEDAARPKGTRSKDPKEPPSDRFSPADWRLHRRIRGDFRAVALTAQDGKERGMPKRAFLWEGRPDG